jgi:hypothetical protein
MFIWMMVLLGVLVIVPSLLTSAPATSGAAPKNDGTDPLVAWGPWVLIFLFIWFVLYRGLMKRNIQRMWDGQPILHRPKHFVLGNDACEVSDSLCRLEHRWTGIVRFIETPNLFMLMTGDFGYLLVPKRAIPQGQIAAFQQFLREHIHPHLRAFPVLPIESSANETSA